MNFHTEIIAELKKKELTARQFAKLKRDLSQKYKLKDIPTNIQILLQCNREEIKLLKSTLLTKPTRTISGVAPVAIMTKPARCPHGKCIYCPGGIDSQWGDVPQSYTGHEPATMRGVRNDYDAYLQVFNRLEQYALLAQNFEKVEIIIMGGTFTSTPEEYQEEFVLGVYKALNDFSELFFEENNFDYIKSSKIKKEFLGRQKSSFDFSAFKEFFELPGEMRSKERTKNIKRKLLELKKKNNFTLEEEKQRNETSNVKCVALCIETKPDWALLEHGNKMLKQGCTRVELGIQSVYDDVLKFVNRGHDSKVSKKSLQVLRDLGFKVNIHYMPGLPLTDRERDLAGMKQLFSDPSYRPDMIKIYPCMVAEGTPLYELYKKGKFSAISAEEAASRIFEWKKVVPEYCRIQRIQRDVPTKMWKSGVEMTNLRQFMHNKYEVNCRCIRCREPKGKKVNWDGIKIKVMEYDASNGKEYFISAESEDILIGFCRLRFPAEILREEITSTSALIRELHVYGTATALGEEGNVQHKGWGKKLMQKAEEIAISEGKNKMVVISGVGVRGYYKKLGYEKEGPYMVKELITNK